VRTTGCATGAAGCATGAATTGVAAGVAGADATGVAPVIEIFGGVTGFGVGGVPPLGAPATGALALVVAACGLFWK
jgi:hypothetical protein